MSRRPASFRRRCAQSVGTALMLLLAGYAIEGAALAVIWCFQQVMGGR